MAIDIQHNKLGLIDTNALFVRIFSTTICHDGFREDVYTFHYCVQM